MNKLAVIAVACVSILGAACARSQPRPETGATLSSPLFAPAPASPVVVGRGSGGVTLADVNRDGHLDLLARHLLGQSLSVWLGDGKGRFAPAPKGPVRFGYQPGVHAVRDVSGDGVPDFVVARRDDDREYVHVFLGDGTGAFAETPGSPVAAAASIKTYKPALRFADVNEDGRADLLTANGRRNTVEVLFGDGRGGFRPGPVLTLEPGRDRYAFEVGDVDGDGLADLVTGSSIEADGPGEIATRRGDGTGGFKESARLRVPAAAGFGLRALADVDGDGRPDVVLTGRGRVSVLKNDGRGAFAAAPGDGIDAGRPAYDLLVADANRDGKADLLLATVDAAAASFESGIVALLGDGRRFAPAPGSPFRAGPGAYTLAAGDLDEDGALDLVASSFEGDAVTVLLGR